MGEEFKCGLQRPESPESMRAREPESNSLQVVMTPTAPPPPIGRIRELCRGSAAGRWAGSVATWQPCKFYCRDKKDRSPSPLSPRDAASAALSLCEPRSHLVTPRPRASKRELLRNFATIHPQTSGTPSTPRPVSGQSCFFGASYLPSVTHVDGFWFMCL